jgi:uncharacterized protein YqcC (DUF446 family)
MMASDRTGKIAIKVIEIEMELKSLHRWQPTPLPEEAFTDMGAFGANTMTFEQWIQFILIPRIHEIIVERGDFPSGSMLAAYAVRYFDGDGESDRLQQHLRELDDLVNQETSVEDPQTGTQTSHRVSDAVSIGDRTIPPVLNTVAELLHQFEGEDLESQLQTFDIFLKILSPSVRPVISDMILNASRRTDNAMVRTRLEKAAHAVRIGKSATTPYDHDEAMRKYRDSLK